jgi:hypothetical protein
MKIQLQRLPWLNICKCKLSPFTLHLTFFWRVVGMELPIRLKGLTLTMTKASLRDRLQRRSSSLPLRSPQSQARLGNLNLLPSWYISVNIAMG